jgi:hypothetical protein
MQLLLLVACLWKCCSCGFLTGIGGGGGGGGGAAAAAVAERRMVS